MNSKNTGCALGYETDTDVIPNDQAAEAINKMTLEGLPIGKLEAMEKYAVELRRKFPHMKPPRLARKVADYFKVKLV